MLKMACQYYRVSFSIWTMTECSLGQSKSHALVWKSGREDFEKIDVHPRMYVCLDEGFEALKP